MYGCLRGPNLNEVVMACESKKTSRKISKMSQISQKGLVSDLAAATMDSGADSMWDHTSIPGITHANQRRKSSRVRRNVWIVLFFLGLALTVYQVQRVLTSYFMFPIVSKVVN